MSFKDSVNSLREKIKGHIKPESSKEELEELNGMLASLDDMEKVHDELGVENAKFKDTIVKMVTSQGDDNPPPSDPSGSKPKSMEQFIEDFQKQNK